MSLKNAIIYKLDQKCVFIKTQEMFNEALKIIEDNGMYISGRFLFSKDESLNYLFKSAPNRFGAITNKFSMGRKLPSETEISFDQFKEIMNS